MQPLPMRPARFLAIYWGAAVIATMASQAEPRFIGVAAGVVALVSYFLWPWQALLFVTRTPGLESDQRRARRRATIARWSAAVLVACMAASALPFVKLAGAAEPPETATVLLNMAGAFVAITAFGTYLGVIARAIRDAERFADVPTRRSATFTAIQLAYLPLSAGYIYRRLSALAQPSARPAHNPP